jgi:hypothetical protein
MNPAAGNITDIAHAIQLALAPVFLLSGIALILNVMTNRLARIIDRGRYFEAGWAQLDPAARHAAQPELLNLERRRQLASRAINASTFAALLVCLVVATLFVEALLSLPLKWLAGVCFIGAMAALIGGLTSFLREVHLATSSVRIPVSMLERDHLKRGPD